MSSILTIMMASLLFSFTSLNQEKPSIEKGKNIFFANCVRCHGTDGAKGKWGAKNLKQSTLSRTAVVNQISNGKGWMPSWKNRLTNTDIESVADYIKTLRH